MKKALPFLALVLSLCGCWSPTQTAGGSTDTGNTLVATVLDGDGTPAGKADISLRRSDYLSPLPLLLKTTRNTLDTSTDEHGFFRMDSLDSGTYRIEVRKGNEWATLFDTTVTPRYPVSMPSKVLAPIAHVSGQVNLGPDALRAFVQVYGMERLVAVNTATGRFDVLLPEGRFTLRFVDPEGGVGGIREKVVTLKAGDSLDIGMVNLRDTALAYSQWLHSKQLWFNTTATGANVTQDVYGFPLLVRLDAADFDFSQASPTGADLRFTKAGGKSPLAYEIERWDATAKQAEIWVRMDTVRGNSSDQYLDMDWGNSLAKDSSNGANVFDTALGFSGVWHLKEGSNQAGFQGYLDATGNHNTGTGVAIADTTVGPGPIGMGQRLSGKGAYIHIPNSPSLNPGAGDFCLSLWARPDSISHSHQLVSKRVENGGDFEFQIEADGHVRNYVGDETGNLAFPSKQAIPIGEWHLLTMCRKGNLTTFLYDGVPDSTVTGPMYNLDNPSDLFIGHDAQNLPEDWQGGIDEVRMSRRAFATEWLRLSFANQVPGSKMISPYRP